MSTIIQFPEVNRKSHSEFAGVEAVIDKALTDIPKKDREKIRFELIKVIDGFDDFFTQWSLTVPADADETFKQQIYDIAHQEHSRKMRMLAEITRLRIKVLVAEYNQSKRC